MIGFDTTCEGCDGLHVDDAEHLDALCRRKPAPGICACEGCCGWVGLHVAKELEQGAALLRAHGGATYRKTAQKLTRTAAYLRENGRFPVDADKQLRDLAFVFGAR